MSVKIARCPVCTVPLPCSRHGATPSEEEKRRSALSAGRCPTCSLPLPCARHGADLPAGAEFPRPQRRPQAKGVEAEGGIDAAIDRLFDGFAFRVQSRIVALQERNDAKMARCIVGQR
mmetsp:Transcript_64376/g.178948  ORF Transcript_64376/g.178948 Transcript_64376/m.178948 type:complete len:118 (+) Transcript_64376:86-439(+)